jgi:hypothetical protein
VADQGDDADPQEAGDPTSEERDAAVSGRAAG